MKEEAYKAMKAWNGATIRGYQLRVKEARFTDPRRGFIQGVHTSDDNKDRFKEKIQQGGRHTAINNQRSKSQSNTHLYLDIARRNQASKVTGKGREEGNDWFSGRVVISLRFIASIQEAFISQGGETN